MLLHEARSGKLSNKKFKRIGRGPGSGKGKTAGRGREGATSRSGWSMKVTYEGGQMPLFRRLPKRGFRNGPFREVFAVVNVGDLAKAFSKGGEVGRAQLVEKGLFNSPKGTPLKVLGDGELAVALTVTADKFSKSAVEKIEKAGGKAVLTVPVTKKPAPNFVREARLKRLAEGAEKAVAELKASKAKGKPKGKADEKKKSKK